MTQIPYYEKQLNIFRETILPYKFCLLSDELLIEYLKNHKKKVKLENHETNNVNIEPFPILNSITIGTEKSRFYKLPKDLYDDISIENQLFSLDLASIYCALLMCPKEIAFSQNTNNTIGSNQHTKEIHYLDVCTSPGMKLLIISRFFFNIKHCRFTALDISKDRLIVTRNLFKKWNRFGNIRLIRADGTQFKNKSFERNGKWDLNSFIWEGGEWYNDWIQYQKSISLTKKRKRSEKLINMRNNIEYQLKNKYLNKELNNNNTEILENNQQDLQDSKINSELNKNSLEQCDNLIFTCPHSYDYIILDAECTTDGSFKHIHEFMDKHNKGIQEFLKEKSGPKKVEETVQLQKDLIYNAFSQLKVGGVLQYSTCSLMNEQNEDVVSWLLDKAHGSAILINAFESSVLEDMKSEIVWREGTLNHTLRFDPETTGTNGLFIAKIRRIK